jgi:hypothetical protein
MVSPRPWRGSSYMVCLDHNNWLLEFSTSDHQCKLLLWALGEPLHYKLLRVLLCVIRVDPAILRPFPASNKQFAQAGRC